MKLLITNRNVKIHFSNPAEGFKMEMEQEEDYVSTNFYPWETLAPFVSAVVDYSWSNGLAEVSKEGLEQMRNSLVEAVSKIDKEIEWKSKNN